MFSECIHILQKQPQKDTPAPARRKLMRLGTKKKYFLAKTPFRLRGLAKTPFRLRGCAVSALIRLRECQKVRFFMLRLKQIFMENKN